MSYIGVPFKKNEKVFRIIVGSEWSSPLRINLPYIVQTVFRLLKYLLRSKLVMNPRAILWPVSFAPVQVFGQMISGFGGR